MASLPIGHAGPPQQDVLHRIAAADVVRKPGPGGDEHVRDRCVGSEPNMILDIN
jgi:hypothetical protein